MNFDDAKRDVLPPVKPGSNRHREIQLTDALFLRIIQSNWQNVIQIDKM